MLASTTASTDTWRGLFHRGDQVGVRCALMRGGTSRGAVLRAEDLPANRGLRERLILAIYGSPDLRQVDGIGGADLVNPQSPAVCAAEREHVA